MPAYFDTGFSVREPMWHGEGIVLDEYPTDWADARTKAGLTWEPEERPAFNRRPLDAFPIGAPDSDLLGGSLTLLPDGDVVRVVPADAVPVGGDLFVPVPDHKLIVRNDNEMVLGVTSDQFSVIYHGGKQRASMEMILDAFTKGGAKFETAGACRDGRQVWALLYLDEPYKVPGDDSEHLPFIALLNNHDGSGAARITRTQVRVVCWNTFQMALASGDRHGLQYSFRHVGDVGARIEEARQALEGLRSESTEYIELATDMLSLRADDKSMSKFISEFLPSPTENGEVVSDRVEANVSKARSMFKHLYLDSPTTEAVRGTAWGLVQASTEYLDHARAFRTADSFLGRSILRAEPAKAKALEIARRVCK